MRTSTSFASTVARLFGAVFLLAVAGCGSRIAYAPVQGKVTLAGKPLSGVKVWFYPVIEGNADVPPASGITDTAGVYTLTSRNGQEGAMVGKHRVVVNWPPAERTDDQTRPPPPQGPPIPTVYTQASKTPLLFEVKAGGPQTIDLPLHGGGR